MTRGLRTMMIVAGAAALLAACETDDVIRNVELSLDLRVPEGHTALIGDELSVDFHAVEELGADVRFVVWAETGTGAVALAERAAPGEVEVDLAAAGLAIADVHGVLVSEEPAGADLPTGSPTAVFLEGELVGELVFGGLGHHDFEEAAGSCELHNDEIHVMAAGLPGLPDGYSYAVWLMFMPAEGGGHSHSGDDDGHGDMMMMHMGELDGAGMLMGTGDQILGGASTVTVTIESASGADMMSASTVLSGEVTYESEGGGAGEQGGGGHMH